MIKCVTQIAETNGVDQDDKKFTLRQLFADMQYRIFGHSLNKQF